MIKNLNIFIFLIYACIYPNRLVNGTVIDCKTNLPIPGAEIIINKKELNQESKFTNFDGYFEIEVSTNSEQILIKYPKYKKIKISIGNKKNLGEITLFKRGCKK